MQSSFYSQFSMYGKANSNNNKETYYHGQYDNMQTLGYIIIIIIIIVIVGYCCC